MATILNIDTATETASLCIARDGKAGVSRKNENPRDHASWLHRAMESALHEAGLSLQDLDAIALTAGPGSYTGLRLGMAAVKGLCYALNIPMITENTLRVMTRAALPAGRDLASVFCPMIDARRMEVFTALYDEALAPLEPPRALVLDENSFAVQLARGRILFFGDGSGKWERMTHHPNALFRQVVHEAADLVVLSEMKFANGEFTDIITSEPVYIKDFHAHIKK
jgi:tRNA threonylcarbamoyladenosine biosynthesis protein TsaB